MRCGWPRGVVVGLYRSGVGHVGGFCDFLLVADFYSKWWDVHFMVDPNTQEVIRFFQWLFAREGFPKEIVSDNRVQFTSKQMSDFLNLGFASPCGFIPPTSQRFY